MPLTPNLGQEFIPQEDPIGNAIVQLPKERYSPWVFFSVLGAAIKIEIGGEETGHLRG